MGKRFLRTESVTLVTFLSFVESNTQAQFQSVEEDSPPKKAKKSRKMKETILYDAQKMIPSSSESDDDDDSPEEEEKVNDSLFQQSQAQFQSVDATSDDSDIQSQSLLK